MEGQSKRSSRRVMAAVGLFLSERNELPYQAGLPIKKVPLSDGLDQQCFLDALDGPRIVNPAGHQSTGR